MRYTLKKPIIIWCFIIMFLIGIVFGQGMDNDFLALYLGRLTIITFRYAIIIVTLLTDYLVFENLNHYTILCRYKSLDCFILKAILIEALITILLTITFNIPIIIFNFNILEIVIKPTILFITNTIIIMLLFTSLIRLFNIWINNRVLSSSIIFALYVLCDFVV